MKPSGKESSVGPVHLETKISFHDPTAGIEGLQMLRHAFIGLFGRITGLSLFDAIYEVCSNSLRHGQCSEVDITVTSTKDMINVVIFDNGMPIDKTKREKIARFMKHPAISPGTGLCRILSATTEFLPPQWNAKKKRNKTELRVRNIVP